MSESFREYELRQRQERLTREQERVEQEKLKKQQALEQLMLREQERREVEQVHPIDQVNLQVKKIIEEDRIASITQLAEDLRMANQQRDTALRVAHKRIEAIRARHPDVPYDTFAEQYFHERWKKTYPEIELIPQYHIGPFRVDFCHESTKTVIELNGSIHRKRRVQNRDAPRHRYLESVGWHVLPFTNDETAYYLDAVAGEIYACIMERRG